MFDIYEANLDNSARFVIGEAGSRPLHIIALNPSTADQNKSDTTITKIKHFYKFLDKNSVKLREEAFDIKSCIGMQISKQEAYDINVPSDLSALRYLNSIKNFR